MNQPLPLLSICIPVKDFDVHPLVNALLIEIHEQQLNAEILILEDGSTTSSKLHNEALSQQAKVSLFYFDKNKGRSAARNFMAKRANGEYLLFIDADSLPVSPLFISIYLAHLVPDTILSGGRHYSERYRTPDRLLHWKYGIHREFFSSINNDRIGFQSNNFIIKKTVFDAIQFDESLILYGHEDTLFGIMAKNQGIVINNIENPVIHTCLETNDTFLSKAEDGVKSLLQIIKQRSNYPVSIEKEFRLWVVYKKIEQYNMLWGLQFLSLFTLPIRKILVSLSGPLLLFDLYKLLLLHQGSVTIQSGNK